jgi:hypothetical protein
MTMEPQIHREMRRAAVQKALRIALVIGRHGLCENEADLCSELSKMAMARSTGELLAAYHGLYLQLGVAGVELPPELMH